MKNKSAYVAPKRTKARPSTRKADGNGGSKSKSSARWAQIIAVAIELFNEKGFAATSMQDVSDRVGLLKGSLYYYVRSKEDLLFEILKDLHERGEEIIRSIDFASDDPLNELRQYLIEITIYSGRNADRLGIFLRDFQFVPTEHQREIIRERDMYTTATARLIERAIAVGQVSSTVDPRTAANAMLRAGSGTHEWYRPSGTIPLRTIAEQTAEIQVRGIAAIGRD